jgi:Domain of unknown function (DUF4383)
MRTGTMNQHQTGGWPATNGLWDSETSRRKKGHPPMRLQAQRFAQIFGAIYLAVGILGFAFTGLSDFASSSGDQLIFFGVNPLHNIVHILVGALWLGASRSEQSARIVTALIGAVYLVVGVLGLFINGSSDLNILNINQPDNVLHLVSALLSLYVGLASRRSSAMA